MASQLEDIRSNLTESIDQNEELKKNSRIDIK